MTKLSYPFTMHPLGEDEGGGYLIEFPDLPGCMSDGETPEAAIRNGADAVQCWIAAMQEAGRPVPPPSRAAVGTRVVGVEPGLYASLAASAERMGLQIETIVNLSLTEHLARSLSEARMEGKVPVKR